MDEINFFGRPYHWGRNKKNALSLHKGEENKCRRAACKSKGKK